MIWTTAFWKGAIERSVKTFAQTLAAYFVIGTTGLLEVDWPVALSVSGAAALASVLTSIGNADFTAGAPAVTTVVTQVAEDPFAGVDDEADPFADVPLEDVPDGSADFARHEHE